MAFFNQYQQQPASSQSFYTHPQLRTPQLSGNIQGGAMGGQYMDSSIPGMGNSGEELSKGILAAFSVSGYPGESSLLEELGINFDHIKGKTLGVLNPMGRISPTIMNDSDLAGPILFCFLFGTCLLLSGKIHFGYIYGVALFGSISLHMLFNLMSLQHSIDFAKSASVLGYCMLPLVVAAGLGIVVSLDNFLGYIFCSFVVFWCTFSASGFFTAVLNLQNVRMLVAYPLAIFYSTFALMTIFVEKS